MLGSAFLASWLLLPPQRTVDAMAVVDLGARAPQGLRWTLGRGLALAVHVKGASEWTARPLAMAGPGNDLPTFELRGSEVQPVSQGRVPMPVEESVWLSSAGRDVSVLVASPGGALRFGSYETSQRLSGRAALRDCLAR